MEKFKVHFSVDDVIKVFRWIKENEPDSIFDTYFFETLRKLYRKHKVLTTLYLFEECENFNITGASRKILG
jgi:hypothetical protein